MQDIYRLRSADLTPRVLSTPERARELYSGMAREVLRDVPLLDRMGEDVQERLIADTAHVIATIVFKHGGHFRNTSPDVAWSALTQAYPRRTANGSATGRFILTLGKSARGAYFTAFAMLEAGVSTREELARIGRAPEDPLLGLRRGLRRVEKDVSAKTGSMDETVLPRLDDLAEL